LRCMIALPSPNPSSPLFMHTSSAVARISTQILFSCCVRKSRSTRLPEAYVADPMARRERPPGLPLSVMSFRLAGERKV
jgi:hypothetical protein